MALNICRSSKTCKAPSTSNMVNQTNITGPNRLPIEAVPNCCMKKKSTRMDITIMTTVSLPSCIPKEGNSLKPSMADVMEMGGVIIPSASREAPPIIAGMTSHFFLLLTRAKRAKVPPSPRLSARSTRITYLIVV